MHALMERNGLIRTWYDRALSAGEKWEARILQELNDADVIVCQLSRDFLASDFCVLTELELAIRRKESAPCPQYRRDKRPGEGWPRLLGVSD